MTVSDIATQNGLKSFDTALPQAWADEVQNATGQNPAGHFVWSYDGPGVFGNAFAVTVTGTTIAATLRGLGWEGVTDGNFLAIT